jgi:hypothetical protein
VGLKETIEIWCKAHPALTDYFQELNDSGVRWAIFAGASVSLLTGNRAPTDIDIIVHDDDLEKVIALTPQATQKLPFEANMPTSGGETLHYRGDELEFEFDGTEVEVMARATTVVGDSHYDVSFTDLAVQNRLAIVSPQTTIYIAHPFDTIAIKSLMQRGAEQNKFDLEDAKALIASYALPPDYVQARMKEIGLDARACGFLRRAGLEVGE